MLTRLNQHTHSGLIIPGSVVGYEHVKQCISALEYYRFNHQHKPRYKTEPESQRPLRDDSRIKLYETQARAREPERIASSQSRKAAGTSAGMLSILCFFIHALGTKPM